MGAGGRRSESLLYCTNPFFGHGGSTRTGDRSSNTQESMYSNLTSVRFLLNYHTSHIRRRLLLSLYLLLGYSESRVMFSLEPMLTCLSAMTGSESNYVLLGFACLSSPVCHLR